jgi:hypothetical protein
LARAIAPRIADGCPNGYQEDTFFGAIIAEPATSARDLRAPAGHACTLVLCCALVAACSSSSPAPLPGHVGYICSSSADCSPPLECGMQIAGAPIAYCTHSCDVQACEDGTECVAVMARLGEANLCLPLPSLVIDLE